MSKLNISEASRATGKARSTIKRHITNGKLTGEEDALGNRVIDVSELQRVYGVVNIEPPRTMQQSGAASQPEPPQTSQLDLEVEILRVKLQAAERRADTAEAEKERLLSIVETQTKQLAAPREEELAAKRKGFLAWLLGS